jgi:hypothetical protein
MEATAYQKIRDSLLRLYLDDPRSWLVSYSGGYPPPTRFDEAGDAAFLLKRMACRQVQLPGKRDYWPDKMHLTRHRREHDLEYFNPQPKR